ncbi:MAG: hypothetical protein K2I47_03710 [Odoribacter sp.]|nr:hypothetical protein [Odoribacter sp.]
MKQEIYKDKALSQLFSREETCPVSELLNKQIMQKVYRTQKRREIRNLCIAGTISLLMLAGVFILLKYYLKVDFSIVLQGFTKKSGNWQLPDLFPALFISLIVCGLLWIDLRMRKKWLRT